MSFMGASRAATMSPPGSIPADCSTDVTSPATAGNSNTNLQAWFNTVPNGSTVNLPANACYNTEYPFLITGRSNITINGNNATFEQKTNGSGLTYSGKDDVRTRGSVKIQDSSNITISGLQIKGTRTGAYTGCYNPNLEAQHAFNISGSSGTVLTNVTVHDVWGDFLEFANGNGGALSANSTVSNSNFSGAGRQGIGLTWTDGVNITGSNFDTVCRTGIDIEPLAPSSGTVHNVTIQNTTWHNFNYAWFSAGGSSTAVGNITIKNNTTDRMNVSASTPAGPTRRSGFYFTGNTTSSPARNEGSYSFDNINDIIVQSNAYVSSAPDPQVGVELSNVTKARITANNVNQSTPGVRVRNAVSDVIVQGNTYAISAGNQGYRAILATCTTASGACTYAPYPNTASVYECNNTYPGLPVTPCPTAAPPPVAGGGGSTQNSTNAGNSASGSSSSSGSNNQTSSAHAPQINGLSDLPGAIITAIRNPAVARAWFGRYYNWIRLSLILLLIVTLMMPIYELMRNRDLRQTLADHFSGLMPWVHSPQPAGAGSGAPSMAALPTSADETYSPGQVFRPSGPPVDSNQDNDQIS